MIVSVSLVFFFSEKQLHILTVSCKFKTTGFDLPIKYLKIFSFYRYGNRYYDYNTPEVLNNLPDWYFAPLVISISILL